MHNNHIKRKKSVTKKYETAYFFGENHNFCILISGTSPNWISTTFKALDILQHSSTGLALMKMAALGFYNEEAGKRIPCSINQWQNPTSLGRINHNIADENTTHINTTHKFMGRKVSPEAMALVIGHELRHSMQGFFNIYNASHFTKKVIYSLIREPDALIYETKIAVELARKNLVIINASKIWAIFHHLH